jgi:hypothetical protein
VFRATAKQIVLGNRVDPLLFGYFAWPNSDQKLTIKEAGSGMFVAPRLGLSARHAAKSFERFDPQFDALNRRKTPLDHQYQMKPVVCDFGSMIYQATRSKPTPGGEEQILWMPLTGFGSFDTDIVSVLVEPRTKGAREIEAEQRFFEWHLLPPPVGSLVSIYGLPEQRIEVQAEKQTVEADVWWWNARVDSHHRFYAHGFGDFPVYELHRELPGGFSGAPVFYNGRLAGIFIGPALVACLWPLALHTYWDKQGQVYSFADHFDSDLISVWDWDEVKGRVERAPCSEVVAGLDVEPCLRTHVMLR